MRNQRTAWNKGRLLGQKPPLKPKEIWSLRIRLQLADKARDLALFNLAIDSKLRGCDLVSLQVRDVYQGNVSHGVIFAPVATCSLAAARTITYRYASTAAS
jgi:hypothetical protein